MAMDLSPPRHRANFNTSHPHAEWAWPCGKDEDSTGAGRSPKTSAMKSSVGNTSPVARDSVRSSVRKVSVSESVSESEPPTMTQVEADRLIGVAGAVLVEGASPGSSPRSGQGQRLYMWWPATLLGRNRDDSYAVEVQQHAVWHRWEKCRLRSLRRNIRVEVDDEGDDQVDDAVEEDVGQEHIQREEEEQERELPEMSGGGQAEVFRVRRKAGVSWGLSLTDGSEGVFITAVHEGSPADAACVPMGRLVQLNGVPVRSLGMCGALRDLTETTLLVLPGLTEQHDAEEEEEAEEEEAPEAQPEARVQHSPRRSIGDFSPPRHHGHFDPSHPDADRAWPRDAQPGSSPRGERSLGVVHSSPTSHQQFQDQKRRHLQAMDASSERRSSVASASSQPRGDESSQARYAHDKRLHQATVSQRSPRAAPAGNTSPRGQVRSHAEYQREKNLGVHETDDWSRHQRRGSTDGPAGRRGSRASDCNELSPPRHSPRFRENHPHANFAWPSNVQPGSSPRRESAASSPRAASVASTGTVEGGATYEEVETRYGVAGVFEVKGASGQSVWFPATVTGPGTEEGTFSVDVHQYRLVKWHRVLPRSIRWKGGQRPADDDELM